MTSSPTPTPLLVPHQMGIRMGQTVDGRHPSGASPAAHGALAWPTSCWPDCATRTAELDATAELVNEAADYPLVIVPNFVPTTPPAAEIQRLRSIIANTPVQVAPPIPTALHVGTRKKRIAITAEAPPAKSLQKSRPRFTDLRHLREGVRQWLTVWTRSQPCARSRPHRAAQSRHRDTSRVARRLTCPPHHRQQPYPNRPGAAAGAPCLGGNPAGFQHRPHESVDLPRRHHGRLPRGCARSGPRDQSHASTPPAAPSSD